MAREEITALQEVVFETAAEHIVTRGPVAKPEDRVGEVRRSLEGKRFDTLAAVVVTDQSRFVGFIRIEELMAAQKDDVVREVMDPSPPVVGPGVDQEVAAWQAVQHGESVLAVADDQQLFLGLIPPERMLGVLLWEHDEDVARLGGFLHDAGAARQASRESVLRRFWHRLPWLFIGLGGALLATEIVASFEERLRSNITLAFFVPGIVYMADAVGTQTETLVIRGLSVGVGIKEMVTREVLTGILVGLALSVAFLPIALWRWENDVAVATALALLGACATATFVAMTLPWLISRVGWDPAYGSGPLATVIQDLASILIYFGIALPLVD
jgi:magnesium transporter